MAASTLPAAASAQAPPAAKPPHGIRGRIVRIAASQLGYRDQGRFCSRFGPCEPWCSLFETWVWRRAGVQVPVFPFTGSLYQWSKLNTYVLPPAATPRPGDAVLFGTGPRTVGTSVHVGVVEDVYPGYLVTIEGDAGHRVLRLVVPTDDPERIGEGGPIYGYASPVAKPGAAALAAARPAPRLSRSQLGAAVSRQDARAASNLQTRRLQHTIRLLRAFQHMPHVTPGVTIDWTGVDPLGRVEVAVTAKGPPGSALAAWQRFLARWGDSGQAYLPTFTDTP